MRYPDTFPVLTTERLVLRETAAHDVQAVFDMERDPVAMRYWSKPPMQHVNEAQASVERAMRYFAERSGLRWSICRAADDQMLGHASLFGFHEQCARAEIGYGLDRRHWGQGIMHEALTAVVGYAFGPLGLLVTLAVVTGAGLRSSWGAPALSFAGLVAVTALGRDFGPRALHPIARAIVGVLLVVPVVVAGVHLGRGANEARPSRAHWPQAEMAARFRVLWREQTGRPLRYVAGHFWPAGLIALSGRDMPIVIVDGNISAAPGTTLS
ncbi:MAG: GNAT family N-acetyltransferase, partial [Candidatus Eisenbacteria bacterium]